MKRLFAMVAVLAVLFSGVCFGAEQLFPSKDNSGSLGKSTRYWGSAYITDVYGTTVHTADPNIIQSVASKDWSDASGTWTLSSTESKAYIIYNQNSSVASWVIIAPAEKRVYTVYNNGAGAGTFKKSGGTGVTIPAYGIYQVAYFAVGASEDYHVLSSGSVVPTADRL